MKVFHGLIKGSLVACVLAYLITLVTNSPNYQISDQIARHLGATVGYSIVFGYPLKYLFNKFSPRPLSEKLNSFGISGFVLAALLAFPASLFFQVTAAKQEILENQLESDIANTIGQYLGACYAKEYLYDTYCTATENIIQKNECELPNQLPIKIKDQLTKSKIDEMLTNTKASITRPIDQTFVLNEKEVACPRSLDYFDKIIIQKRHQLNELISNYELAIKNH